MATVPCPRSLSRENSLKTYEGTMGSKMNCGIPVRVLTRRRGRAGLPMVFGSIVEVMIKQGWKVEVWWESLYARIDQSVI